MQSLSLILRALTTSTIFCKCKIIYSDIKSETFTYLPKSFEKWKKEWKKVKKDKILMTRYAVPQRLDSAHKLLGKNNFWH